MERNACTQHSIRDFRRTPCAPRPLMVKVHMLFLIDLYNILVNSPLWFYLFPRRQTWKTQVIYWQHHQLLHYHSTIICACDVYFMFAVFVMEMSWVIYWKINYSILSYYSLRLCNVLHDATYPSGKANPRDACCHSGGRYWAVNWLVLFIDTVHCPYNADNFRQNLSNRQPIARPWGRVMGCLLWF